MAGQPADAGDLNRALGMDMTRPRARDALLWIFLVVSGGILIVRLPTWNLALTAVGWLLASVLFVPFELRKARLAGLTWSRSLLRTLRQPVTVALVGTVLILLSILFGESSPARMWPLDPLMSMLGAGASAVGAGLLIARMLEVGPFAPEPVDGRG